MLNFIGYGACLNPLLGNTSAYIMDTQALFLLDCGGTVFEKIIRSDLLDNIKNITIAITHTHSDHIGSLPDLIFYCYYYKDIQPTLIYPSGIELKKYLTVTGVNQSFYEEMQIPLNSSCSLLGFEDLKITPTETNHTKDLSLCCGYLIEHKNKRMYYSGDSNSIPEIILDQFLSQEIDILYQDVSGNKMSSSAHLYINELKKLVPTRLRKHVVCMHLDAEASFEMVKYYGFCTP